MSHLKERVEKVCLNCNAQLSGPFCHICGQENIEPKESVWHLVTHFFNDITHFDGKFFSTVGLLIRRPGFLPREYMQGRRASYLNPIRMYIFTSAIFFLVFFSVVHLADKNYNDAFKFDDEFKIKGLTPNEIRELSTDSLSAFTARLNKGKPLSHPELQHYFDSMKISHGFHLTGTKYESKQQYDSLLNSGVKKHNWFQRKLIYKEIEANKKYHNNQQDFFVSFLNTFIHSFPQILFVSLPLFALFLKLLYRRKKEFYYVSHGIFSIHFYIFIFITLLFIIGLGELKDLLHWKWLSYIRTFLGFAIFFYLYKAMRNFYQQRRFKTIVKFVLLNILTTFMMAVLFIFFILFSFMKI